MPPAMSGSSSSANYRRYAERLRSAGWLLESPEIQQDLENIAVEYELRADAMDRDAGWQQSTKGQPVRASGMAPIWVTVRAVTKCIHAAVALGKSRHMAMLAARGGKGASPITPWSKSFRMPFEAVRQSADTSQNGALGVRF
jgi:hypothetical protein